MDNSNGFKKLDRKRYNNALLVILTDYLTKYPDIRFNQALLNLGLVVTNKDDYYTEPDKVLIRVLKE